MTRQRSSIGFQQPRTSAQAYQAALSFHQQGNVREAERLYEAVLKADPNHFGSLHHLGMIRSQSGDLGEAVRLIRRALAQNPAVPEAHYNLANAFAASNRLDDALAHYAKALALKPDYVKAHNNLGNVLSTLDRLEEAAVSYERAIAISPGYAEAHNNLGTAYRALSRLEEAIRHYRKALALSPDYAAAHYNLGNALAALDRHQEAIACYEKAVALQPGYVEAHHAVGDALQAVGRPDDALAHYERALAFRPGFAECHNSLGTALRTLKQSEQAVAHYERAVAFKPDFAEAHCNLGDALNEQGKLDDALTCYGRALAAKPNFAPARFGLCMGQLPILYRDEGEIAARRASYREHLAALCDDVERWRTSCDFSTGAGWHQPFYLAYQGYNDRDLQSLYGSLMCRIMADRYPPLPPGRPPGPDERVRVGIVSGFIWRHSNWKFLIKGWLTRLDRRQFEVLLYYTGSKKDAETGIAAASCDRFVQGPLSVRRWRETILADAPHVLIYPEVGMDPMAAQLAAQRLAPVQCNSWGHPDTSGFPTLDYYLSSDLMEPPNGQEHYTERLVRLPNLSIYYEPVDARPVAINRSELGLRETAVAYWCAQALYKYLPQFDSVYPRIARGVGDCQFVFVAHPSRHITAMFQKRIDDAFAAFGLRAADFCVLLPPLDQDRFIAATGRCDIFLDSVGWSGCNTTLESLAHDLPIVTITGSLMRGRHTSAILRMIGLTDTIAETVDEYVSLAARLGHDSARRTAIKDRLAATKYRLYRDTACISALEEFLNRVARDESAIPRL